MTITRYILPILILLLAVTTYKLGIEPLYEDIHVALVKEAEVKAALVEADAAQERLNEIAKRYESFPPDAEQRLSEIIPEKVDPIRLLAETTVFLERNGFSAKSLAVSTDDNGSGEGGNTGGLYRTYLISFTIPASYDIFRTFLRTLEDSLALRDSADVSFGATSISGTRGRSPELYLYDYNVQIVGYSLR
ncbi:MAG: hypothetical protein A3C13_03205 [Candidatus Lloydbacteria bacterium RIFCSPHIGHO2_02_FULL_50_11]|nr:MAG: hypothetical protein A3C13_03205 [Candidatus Lloydbacteria bacterium RIFCSPHIGHO2_02_FULL_50_11]